MIYICGVINYFICHIHVCGVIISSNCSSRDQRRYRVFAAPAPRIIPKKRREKSRSDPQLQYPNAVKCSKCSMYDLLLFDWERAFAQGSVRGSVCVEDF